MTIQWYPGHMQETEKFLKTAVSSVDVVLEILDARLPVSSANPLLDKICRDVFRIRLLNKKDMADPHVTGSWIDWYHKKDSPAVAVIGTDPADTWRAVNLSLSGLKKAPSRRIRIMAAGIPNTGKSTIINTLAGKKIAKTGNTPAVTRHQQRVGLKNRIDIYDTPGILWPVLENQKGACRLAVSGAISDAALDYGDIVHFALTILMERYPGSLEDRYGISLPESCREDSDSSGAVGADPGEILERIGILRGCLKKGGIVDYKKTSELVIRELRSGKLGRVSLETPDDIVSEKSEI
ncbi:MAG: ribosome biogenesis GTPase YlqF [Desulfamplus sp.]|nr:ribosome biogenesis GTPase YlqF [Desulfamplus sp.]